MNKQTYDLIELLERFFKSEQAIEFTLFVWGSSKKTITIENSPKSSEILELYYQYKINIDKTTISSGKTASLFPNVLFTEKFMDKDNNYELNNEIQKKVNKLDMSQLSEVEIMNYRGLFTGTTFERESWKDKVDRIFGVDTMKIFYKKSLYENLKTSLDENKQNEIRQKV